MTRINVTQQGEGEVRRCDGECNVGEELEVACLCKRWRQHETVEVCKGGRCGREKERGKDRWCVRVHV